MVKAAYQLPLACAIALLSASLLHAKEDVVTPVPLNVIDSNATAARNQARQEREQMLKMRAEAIQMHRQAWSAENQILSIHLRNQYLTAALAGVSVLTLLALWGLVRHRHRASLLPSRASTTDIVAAKKGQPMLPANLALYLSNAQGNRSSGTGRATSRIAHGAGRGHRGNRRNDPTVGLGTGAGSGAIALV
jgi:hypothetical protein